MKKQVLAILLALAMALALLPAAALAAEDGEQSVTVSTNLEQDILLEKKPYQLVNWKTGHADDRNVPWEWNSWDTDDWDTVREGEEAEWFFGDGDYIFLDSENVSEFTPDSVYVLPKDATLMLQGKGGRSMNNEMVITGKIYVSAWSDPDKDGIYQQRVTNTRYIQEKYPDHNWNSSAYPLPISETKPMKGITGGITAGDAINNTSLNWLFESGNNALVAGERGDAPGIHYFAAETELSGALLWDMFGPESLIEIAVQIDTWDWDNYMPIGSKYTKFYCYLSDDHAPVPTFTDVPDYFADAVAWAASEGITNGNGDGTFGSANNCKQEHILTFLWRSQNKPAPSGANPYTGLDTNMYYADAAIWAYEQGLITDKDQDFGEDCTRGEVVTYMWKLAGRPRAEGDDSFTDVPAENEELSMAVRWAKSTGITSGYGNGLFGTGDTCTRGQIVTFLYRAYAN